MSQKPFKDSNGINSISVAVNTETISQEALNVLEAFVSRSPNTVKASKTNPNELNLFITVTQKKEINKTSSQVDNENNKSNSHSDKNIAH